MKTIRIVISKMDAQMLVGYLQSNDIDAHIRGAREYAGIVTGTDVGRFEIMVPDDQVEQSQQILEELDRRSAVSVVAPTAEPTPWSLGRWIYAFWILIFLFGGLLFKACDVVVR